MQKKIFWWITIGLWCGGIFYQSSKPAPASDQESLWIVAVMNAGLQSLFGANHFEVTNGMVRKTAHLTEYLILGLLLFNGFFLSKKIRLAFYGALTTGILYAVSDEVHQLFVPGRTCRLTDVMIDTAGISLGILIVMLALRNKARRASQNAQ
jgi:VanZ family protein